MGVVVLTSRDASIASQYSDEQIDEDGGPIRYVTIHVGESCFFAVYVFFLSLSPSLAPILAQITIRHDMIRTTFDCCVGYF